MASQTQGIQQLLAAEKKAAEKVSEARKRKFCVEQFIIFIQMKCEMGVCLLSYDKHLINFCLLVGKARRLKQAKEEAQQEIEKYRQDREKAFKEFEAKV